VALPLRSTRAQDLQSGLSLPRRYPTLCLILLTLLLYTAGTHLLPLMDRDEPRFATAAREMNEASEIVVPTFNGKERLDKPILIYWGMQASYAVLGTHEFAARLPSVLCMLGLVLLVHRWGRHWYGPDAGLLAGIVTATSLQFLIHGRLAVADMPMILALATAHYGLFGLLGLVETDAEKKARDFGHEDSRWFWIFYVSLGLGFLAKGPIAWGIPLLTLILYCKLFWRQDVDLSRLRVLPGIAVVLGIVLPWGLFALIETQLRFFTEGIGYHVVDRGLEPLGGRTWIPGFYALTVFLSLMPWIAYAGAIFYRIRTRWSAREAFLVSWFVAIFGVFSLFATQLPHYILPGFPAFSLLIASVFTGGEFEKISLRFGRTWYWSVTGVYILLMLALMALAPLPTYEGAFVNVGLALGGAILLIGGLVALSTAVWFRGPYIQAIAAVFALTAGLWTLGITLRRTNPAVQMESLMRAQPREARMVAWRFTEGSLIYYSGRKWDLKLGREDFGVFRAELDKEGSVFAVMVEEEMDLGRWLVYSVRKRFGQEVEWPGRSFQQETSAVDSKEFTRYTFEGFNPGRSRWVRVVALERR
jgi:4-amino-4-deoxy-L-arabinose transferase-like glycosyltransferase